MTHLLQKKDPEILRKEINHYLGIIKKSTSAKEKEYNVILKKQKIKFLEELMLTLKAAIVFSEGVSEVRKLILESN